MTEHGHLDLQHFKRPDCALLSPETTESFVLSTEDSKTQLCSVTELTIVTGVS